jgi:biotin carboxyl carrier protein
MKLKANIGGETVDVEVVRDGDHVTAKVGDREYTIEVAEPEANVYALRDGAKLTEVFVSPTKPGASAIVTVGGKEVEFDLIDPKRLRGSGIDAEHAGGTAEIKTAMPGQLVRILVEVGAEVKKGDGILVVEAMKMQNEMKSPKDGIVKELRSTEGSTVNAGDILAVIE